MDALNSQASALVRLGLTIASSGEANAASRALECFDRALDIRRRLPVESSPALQYDLAGTWLNRAEALTALGTPHHLIEAARALDVAIALLESLPLSLDCRFPRRLAIAYLHRGVRRREDGSDDGAPVRDFLQAITVLEHAQGSGIADRQLLLAACWVNLADGQARGRAEADWRLAVGSAAHAMALIARSEQRDVTAAEIGVRARYVSCRALARLAARSAVTGSVDADVHAATDAVDDALDLIRRWEERGVTRFRPMADDLYRFGLRVYGHFQPHFVSEFESEHSLDASATAAATRTL